MKKVILFLMLGAIVSCHSNPYDGVGPVRTDKEAADDKATPKPAFQLISEAAASGQEGSELVQKLEIRDQANPQGPFGIYLKDFPEGTRLVALSDAKFEIRFLSNGTFVKGQSLRRIRGKIHVVSPDGRFVEQSVDWEIRNKPVPPNLIGPGTLSGTVGTSVQFSVLGEDRNGESFPHVRIVSPALSGLSVVENGLNNRPQDIFPTMEFIVSWTRIPMDLAGQTIPIKIESCESVYQQCRIHEIQMALVAPVQ